MADGHSAHSEMGTQVEPILAVLFDLDGTLVDVEDAHTDAINAVLANYGAFCNWELKKRLFGLPGTLSALFVIM